MAAPAPPVAVHPLPALADETLEEIFLLLHHVPPHRHRALLPPPVPQAPPAAAARPRRRQGRLPPRRGAPPLRPASQGPRRRCRFHLLLRPQAPRLWHPWCARDVRDGRVLLESNNSSSRLDITRIIRTTSYAVCDPLSRRYVLLPPIPEDMTVQQHELLLEFEPNLAPAGEDEDDETCFKVICTVRYETKLVAFVFASVTGQWRDGASYSWTSAGTLYPFNYLSGCFYWPSFCEGKMLVLNTHRMEFSVVSFSMPPDEELLDLRNCTPSIVAGTEGALEMFALIGARTTFYLCHAAQQNNGESSIEWQLKNVKTLPRGYFYVSGGATDGMLFLQGKSWDISFLSLIEGLTAQDFFSLEVKTLELKKVCRGKPWDMPCGCVHSYFGFPPSLLKPSL
ncbi:hypothetical protein ACQ4PT_001073 [Festuca glaucescens]